MRQIWFPCLQHVRKGTEGSIFVVAGLLVIRIRRADIVQGLSEKAAHLVTGMETERWTRREILVGHGYFDVMAIPTKGLAGD